MRIKGPDRGDRICFFLPERHVRNTGIRHLSGISVGSDDV
jgi:hypothetical protein